MSKQWITISNGSDKSYFKIDNLDAEMIICKDDINYLMLALKEVQIREEK